MHARHENGWNRSHTQPKQKESSVFGNASMATHIFPAVNAIPGFVSIKVETVPKVIMDIRRIFQMFQTKATLFKVKYSNTRRM